MLGASRSPLIGAAGAMLRGSQGCSALRFFAALKKLGLA